MAGIPGGCVFGVFWRDFGGIRAIRQILEFPNGCMKAQPRQRRPLRTCDFRSIVWRAEQGMVVATEDGFRSELGGIAAGNATLGIILAAFWLSNLNGRISWRSPTCLAALPVFSAFPILRVPDSPDFLDSQDSPGFLDS